MTGIDILNIDAKIRKNFEAYHAKLTDYKQKINEIDASLANTNIRDSIKNSLLKAKNELQENIHDIETRKSYNFYIMETSDFLEKYKKILKTPIKVSFIGKEEKNDKNKDDIISEYMEIASKYIDINNEKIIKKKQIKCNNCPNKKHFENIETNIYVCTKCYAKQIIIENNSSYADIDRVNISSKYMYDRKTHFRDCINQYQGVSLYIILVSILYILGYKLVYFSE